MGLTKIKEMAAKTLLGFFLLLSFNGFASVYSAQTKLSISVENESLQEIFSQIEKQSDLSIIYRESDINNSQNFTLDMQNTTVDRVLDKTLNKEELNYRVENKLVIIFPSDETAEGVSQQASSITGQVVDKDGMAMPGVSIQVKGTSQGAITDLDGNFTINVEAASATLIFSYIGTKTQEVVATGKKAVSITMINDFVGIDEVVAIGFGSQKRVNLTGSVASVAPSEIESRPVTNVSSSLQGLVPGMTVKQTSGQPGSDGGTIRIRGVGTLNSSNPMVIIDGVESTMDNLSSGEIESISILKDAASASIYGSKAANGVILITTKTGKNGVLNINYNLNVGVSAPISLPEYMGSADYATLYNEALINDGSTARYSDDEITAFRTQSDPYNYPDTDWQKLFYIGSGVQHTHDFNVSGGSDKGRFMVAMGYQDQSGIIEHSSKEQFNIRANMNLNLTERLHFTTKLSYMNRILQEPTNPYVGGQEQIFRQINRISPWIAYKDEDGYYGTISDGNPIAWMDMDATTDTKQHRVMAIASLDYDIIENLNIKVQGSSSINIQDKFEFRKDIQYNPSKYHGPNKATQEDYSTGMKTLDALLNYDTNIDKHYVALLAGYHYEDYDLKYTKAYRQDFPNNDLTDLNAGSEVGMSTEGYTRELNMISGFGRVNYSYDSRYLFEANLRADASSRFAEGNRWGYFPSLSLGWRLSEEEFWGGLSDIFSNAKLRASWGMLGNQSMSDYYPSIPTLDLGVKYPFGSAVTSGAAETAAKNPNISWEETTTTGLGIDLSVGNKLTFVVDYYSRKTDGILMTVTPSETFGKAGYYDNIGKMSNSGLEFAVTYNETFGDVNFTATGNVSYNKNKIENLGEDQFIVSGSQVKMVGEAINSFFGYESDGIIRSDSELSAAPEYKIGTAKVGAIRYKDTAVNQAVDSDDRVILGSSDPKYTFGMSLGADYKGFDIQILMQGAAGVKGYLNGPAIGSFQGDDGKPTLMWSDRFHPTDNPDGSLPGITAKSSDVSTPGSVTSDFWLQNASYLRGKNVQIGYNIPASIMDKLGIKKARVYYSGQNLFTITNFLDGFDPETPTGRGGGYPQLSVNSLGLNITF